MAQKRITIRTTPEIISNVNPKRRSIVITFLPLAIEAGNVGRVHIGKGFPPSATIGDPNQGDPLTAGGQITEQEQFKDDPSVFKGQWWATASQAGQIITVDEVTSE